MNDQMKVRFFKEARSEENFVEEMCNFRCQVRSDLDERSRLMSEIARRVPDEAGARYLDTLIDRQKRDEHKLVLLKELLFLARVETHERKLDKLDDN
nr:hypothetical protein [Tanacetum cinerariifolium]